MIRAEDSVPYTPACAVRLPDLFQESLVGVWVGHF
jgi:hypothetical protein